MPPYNVLQIGFGDWHHREETLSVICTYDHEGSLLAILAIIAIIAIIAIFVIILMILAILAEKNPMIARDDIGCQETWQTVSAEILFVPRGHFTLALQLILLFVTPKENVQRIPALEIFALLSA